MEPTDESIPPSDETRPDPGPEGPRKTSRPRGEATGKAGAKGISKAPGKAARRTPGKTSAKGAVRKAPPEPSEDQIRARAYEMYERRGGAHGVDVDDWLEAERSLQEERHRERDEDLTEEV